MVYKKKHPKDYSKTSGLAKKKYKLSYKGHKKDNYKKKNNDIRKVKVGCCICYDNVDNTSDNSISCGKTIHFICGECKFKLNETGNIKCPMCRSHNIKNPISRDLVLPIYQKISTPHSIYHDDNSRMTSKQQRNLHRNTPDQGISTRHRPTFSRMWHHTPYYIRPRPRPRTPLY